MAAGGRNPQKSAKRRAEVQAKAAKNKNAGGGAKGAAARRSGGKNSLECLICKCQVMTSKKNNVKIEEHVGAKHPKCTIADCFPTRTKEAMAAAAEKAAKAEARAKKGGGKGGGGKGASMDDLLSAGLAGGKKKKKKSGKRRG